MKTVVTDDTILIIMYLLITRLYVLRSVKINMLNTQ
jgi:hypothetical protein